MYFKKNVYLIKTLYYHTFSSQSRLKSTIFSLSSGYGKCGVAVFRVSGPNAKCVISKMTNLKIDSKVFQAKHFCLTNILDFRSREFIDQGFLLWFPGPKSLTGEDVCELQTHGGIAIKQAILSSLSSLPSFKHAQPGEFIRRSFENNKLDLTQVEGLSDMIAAETDKQRKQAWSLYKGEVAILCHKWSQTILKSLAYLEALIDFGEDENLDENIFNNVVSEVDGMCVEMSSLLHGAHSYERVKEGLKVVLTGKSNVGKSSLLNKMCKRDASIVSKHSGTTRDVVEVVLNLAGQAVRLIDTAGLREGVQDEVELLGMARAKNCVVEADLVMCVIDSSQLFEDISFSDAESIRTFTLQHLDDLEIPFKDRNVLVVFNKLDLLPHSEAKKLSDLCSGDSCNPLKTSCSQSSETKIFYTTSSCVQSTGISHLHNTLTNIIEHETCESTNEVALNARQQECLREVYEQLKDASSIMSKHPERFNTTGELDLRLELAADHLREALRCIGAITGKTPTDKVLERIFSDFCIGK